MGHKLIAILLYALPVVVMIALIRFVPNDYVLAAVYVAFIIALCVIKREKHDLFALLFGLIAITAAEAFFVSTGVETFTRRSLLGIMPVWLPLLWGYAFVTIKRSLRVLK